MSSVLELLLVGLFLSRKGFQCLGDNTSHFQDLLVFQPSSNTLKCHGRSIIEVRVVVGLYTGILLIQRLERCPQLVKTLICKGYWESTNWVICKD